MAVQFRDIADLKRLPVERQAKSIKSGFPVPMAKQIKLGPKPLKQKLKFPSPDRIRRVK